MNFTNLHLLLRSAKEFGHSQIKLLGVSDTEHLICTFLFGHSNVSQDDVAASLRLDKTTVARALLSLEKKGYVRREVNSDNRRKNLLSITPLGKENIADVVGVYDEWLCKISSCLSDEEQAQFDEYCARLLAASEDLQKEGR